MIDLHILDHPAATRPDWWKACLESAQAAEAMGWVTLHVVDAHGTSVGANRAEAYRLGNQPFVACLDNDDVLIAEGLPPLLDALERHPEVCGVYSHRQQIDAAGKVLFTLPRGRWSAVNQICTQNYPHLLAVYRRAAVMPYLAEIATFPTYSEFVLAGLATYFGPWLHVPALAYQRREKDYYVNHVRRIDPETTRRARARVIPALKHYF